MNYKSFADLSKDIKDNLHKLPKDVSLVVGIPRSGLLAANLISLYTNLPLTDIDSFIEGKVLCPIEGQEVDKEVFKGKILIVDDSVATGKAIVDAKEKLKLVSDAGIYELIYCCIYADPEKKHLVDIPLLLLERPRVFEWNLFHNKIMEKSGLSLNGVLAKMPGENDESQSEKDLNFLLKAQPYIIPKKKIAAITYSGDETEIPATKKWLAKNGVQYEELLESNDLNVALEYKKRKNLTLFIASDQQEAQQIFDLSGKDVYCLENSTLLTKEKSAGVGASLQTKSKRLVYKIKRKIKTFF